MKRSLFFFLIGFISCVGIATEYFVALDGCDESNDGLSRTSAFASVQRGVDALEAGDTLTILAGEYLGNVRRSGLGSLEAETLIRADQPGTVTLRGDVAAPRFRRLEGSRFVYVANFDPDAIVPAINELDTLTIFNRMPNAAELEFMPATFFHDTAAGKLYIVPSDMRPADEHEYSVSVVPTHGIYLSDAKRVVIEGLGVTGFNAMEQLRHPERSSGGVWGIFLADGKECVIRDCRAWLNGWGIGLNSQAPTSGDNVIERCAAWGNTSQFKSGDMGGITGFRVRRDVIRDSVAFLNGQYGINIYGTGTDGGGYGESDVPGNDEANKSRLINNLAWGNPCDLKIKTGVEYFHTIESSIGTGLWSVRPSVVSHSIIGRSSREFSADSINLTEYPDLDLEAEFADPVNFDFRLQSTSQFRGTGPEGSDRGPFPYQANVFFVDPAGDDAADGLSVDNAWRTLTRALKGRQPGDTVYLLEGTYDLPADIEISTTAEPVSVRGRGTDAVAVNGKFDPERQLGLVFERVELAGQVPPLHVGSAGLPIGFHPGQVKSESLRLTHGPEVHSVSATTANIEWMTSLPATCAIAWGPTEECEHRMDFDANYFGSFSLTGLEPGQTYYFRIQSLRIPQAKEEMMDAAPIDLRGKMITFTTASRDQQGTVYYVAPDGNNANSGRSRSSAWRTIQHAANNVGIGDTVMIGGGTYQERVRIRATGAEGAPITFRSIAGEKVVLDGVNKALTGAISATAKSHLRFDGLYFTDFNFFPGHSSTWMLERAAELSFYKGRDIKVTRCFSDGRNGYTARFVDALDVENLLIQNCVTSNKMSGSMMIRHCPDVRIENCVIVRPMISSFHLWNRPHQPAVVRNNIFTDCLQKKAALNTHFMGFSENIENDSNCYFLRFPSDVRQLVRDKTIHEIDPAWVSNYVVADPGFAGDPGVAGNPDDKSGFSPDRLLNPSLAIDFNSFFATNPELLQRGIGLQPEAFADFHFSTTDE